MFKKLKECKTLKEIYEVIPEEFYEKCSIVLIIAMMMVIVAETFTRMTTRHASFESMINNFYLVGYALIVFTVFFIGSRICKMKISDIRGFIKSNIWDVLLLMLLVETIISAFLAENKQEAFNGSWFRQNGVRTYIIYASIYICGKNIRKSNLKRIIMWVYGTVATFQEILIFSKFMGLYGSKMGAFYNANHCGYFIAMAILVLGALSVIENKIITKIIAYMLFSINVFALVVNDTFGAYVAVTMGIVFITVIYLLKYKKILYEIVILFVLFVTISIIADNQTGNISRNFKITGSDLVKISEKSEDIGKVGTGRGEIWKDSYECIRNKPLTGCGPENLVFVSKFSAEPHNEILQITAENGIIAGITYLLALITIMISKIKHIKHIDNECVGIGTVVFTYIVSSMFGVMIFYVAVFYFMFLGILSQNKVKQTK